MIVQVLDHGYVQLVEKWGSEEQIIEAARMSTDKGFEGWEKDYRLLKYLWKHKHLTPFEMPGLTLEVKAPIMVFREWMRHRVPFGYNEMSARYIPLPNENYLPERDDVVLRSQAAAITKNRQASGTGRSITPGEAEAWLQRLNDYYLLGQAIYEMGLNLGVPKEMARLPVTVGRYSRMRVTSNLRGWIGFLALRMPYTAQKEIRLFAEAVARIAVEQFPKTMSLFMEDLVTEEPKANGHYIGLDRTSKG